MTVTSGDPKAARTTGLENEGKLRIFDADPERVVSVTVGELQNLCKWAYGCGHDFVGMSDATIRERTCHNRAPHYLRFLCPECHHVIYHDDANETGDPDEDGIKFCPNCGARVVNGDDDE